MLTAYIVTITAVKDVKGVELYSHSVFKLYSYT